MTWVMVGKGDLRGPFKGLRSLGTRLEGMEGILLAVSRGRRSLKGDSNVSLSLFSWVEKGKGKKLSDSLCLALAWRRL